jgi:hypothetical protein
MASPIGGGGSVEVSEVWLHKMLVAMAPMLRGKEAARKSYCESGGHARRIVARTDDDRILLSGWREACRAVGLDDDLRHW